jgi:hypothetical protein
MRAGNDIVSVWEQRWESARRAMSGCGRAAKHLLLGYHIKHSLSSIFFVFKVQESGFGIQDSGKANRGYRELTPFR